MIGLILKIVFFTNIVWIFFTAITNIITDVIQNILWEKHPEYGLNPKLQKIEKTTLEVSSIMVFFDFVFVVATLASTLFTI